MNAYLIGPPMMFMGCFAEAITGSTGIALTLFAAGVVFTAGAAWKLRGTHDAIAILLETNTKDHIKIEEKLEANLAAHIELRRRLDVIEENTRVLKTKENDK